MTITAQLNGFLPPDYVIDARVRIAPGAPSTGEMPTRVPPVRIADARALQADAVSEAAFFAEHGFVLLPHTSDVRDWEPDLAAPHTSDIGRIYVREIEAIIRNRLFPKQRIEIQQAPFLLRRGRDTQNPGYANGVHSDAGLNVDDYLVNLEAFAGPDAARAWQDRYAKDDVEAFVWVDFWRPTNMQAPLRHMPLALCDPESVDLADVLPTAMTNIAPSGRTTHHLALRQNSGQRWSYYPGMRTDELLAFKLAELRKDDPGPSRLRGVFHSAFEDPATPADAEHRQSCEHRVGVLVLRS